MPMDYGKEQFINLSDFLMSVPWSLSFFSLQFFIFVRINFVISIQGIAVCDPEK